MALIMPSAKIAQTVRYAQRNTCILLKYYVLIKIVSFSTLRRYSDKVRVLEWNIYEDFF